jgi:hypothetical protein
MEQPVQPTPIVISMMCKAKYKGQLIKPAVVTDELAEWVISLCKRSKGKLNAFTHDQISHLMLVIKNEPADHIYESARQVLNKHLSKHVFEGASYYLVAGEGGYYQLWEVIPPAQ